MGLDTRTDTEEIQAVTDQRGDTRSPATNEAQGNWGALDGFKFTTDGTGEESLPSNDVPDGVTVLVHPLPSNADVVNVGPPGVATYPMASGGSTYTAKVSDTAEISIETPSAGDGVAVHFEVSE